MPRARAPSWRSPGDKGRSWPTRVGRVKWWAGVMCGKLRIIWKFYRMLPREFMKKYISISLWLALVIWLGLPGLPALGQAAKFRPNLDEGQNIYKQNCVNCHGSGGKGDGIAAAQLQPPPADLTASKTREKQDAELLEIIKLGRPGTAMPAWISELDEREIQNVLAYIRSLAP